MYQHKEKTLLWGVQIGFISSFWEMDVNTTLSSSVKYVSDLYRLRPDNFVPVMAALLLVKIWQPIWAMPPTRAPERKLGRLCAGS